MKIKNPIKSLTIKVVRDVKDTVREEANKTTEEIKGDILEASTDVMPYLLVGGIILVGICLARKPAPVTVKVILKQ